MSSRFFIAALLLFTFQVKANSEFATREVIVGKVSRESEMKIQIGDTRWLDGVCVRLKTNRGNISIVSLNDLLAKKILNSDGSRGCDFSEGEAFKMQAHYEMITLGKKGFEKKYGTRVAASFYIAYGSPGFKSEALKKLQVDKNELADESNLFGKEKISGCLWNGNTYPIGTRLGTLVCTTEEGYYRWR